MTIWTATIHGLVAGSHILTMAEFRNAETTVLNEGTLFVLVKNPSSLSWEKCSRPEERRLL